MPSGLGCGAVCRCGSEDDVGLMNWARFAVKRRTCFVGTDRCTSEIGVRVSAKAWVSEPFVDAALHRMWP